MIQFWKAHRIDHEALMESCLPPSVPDRKKKLQFCLGCRVILPPESFLSLRLPFVYGVQLENGNLHPLMPFEQKPQLTAWITEGTTLQLVSKDSKMRNFSHSQWMNSNLDGVD
ncbi:hypothetical protein T459_18108 [Capsicum annuum]|uniref:Nonsense-mediated mRNA decay factor SMG8 n=1 Tax=Capsicum annuum TaxID=4072 RepID=A0A2G2ZDI1_CAPAN|nr:hypothetical protein T459_18108 [Capsicum annuum]